MRVRRRALLRSAAAGLGALAALSLAGCASLRAPSASTHLPHWSGRLSLKVGDDPRQSFSAGFDLSGSPRQGTLELMTPLGGTAALLEWSAAGARLQVPGERSREAPSLEALVEAALGTPVPVAALFDWLAGRPTEVAGWQADLSERPQGRLQARRLRPAAELRLVLDNPSP